MRRVALDLNQSLDLGLDGGALPSVAARGVDERGDALRTIGAGAFDRPAPRVDPLAPRLRPHRVAHLPDVGQLAAGEFVRLEVDEADRFARVVVGDAMLERGDDDVVIVVRDQHRERQAGHRAASFRM
jgi:hypothetical protein